MSIKYFQLAGQLYCADIDCMTAIALSLILQLDFNLNTNIHQQRVLSMTDIWYHLSL